MRVLHLSTNDTGGGAARAAYRLHRGLKSYNVDSGILVQHKNRDDDSIYGHSGLTGKLYSKLRKEADQIPVKKYQNRDQEIFSPSWVPERKSKWINRYDPDIVHLHWIAGGFIKPDTIRQLDASVVWTLHDMWAFTGGCHYSKSCTKYRTQCGLCPHLDSSRQNDLSRRVWRRKSKVWSDSDFVVVAPSQWLAQEARKSSALGEKRIDVIPNCVDTDSFRPRDRSLGIRRFDLEDSNRYLLFGSAYETRRKGGELLGKALSSLDSSNIVALTFGSVNIDEGRFDFPVRSLGYLSESNLRLAYSTADATVIPSREDNLPNIAVESMASGTPCVAFDTGGLPSLIDHKKTGYLADPFDPDSLVDGIKWVLTDLGRNRRLGRQARRVAENRFSVENVVNQYTSLYAGLRNNEV